jgi:hypothetical protein
MDDHSQSGQSIGMPGDGVSGAATQDNDHTSAIGQEERHDATANAGQTGWKTADAAGQVRPGLSVVDREGRHLGTVDRLDGERIKLTRGDSADGRHSYIATSEVASVEGNEVRLSCRADAVQS